MKSGNITLGGILIALTIIILYSASILPVSTISVLTIASAIVPVCIIRSDVKTAVMVYLASSIISVFFFIPGLFLCHREQSSLLIKVFSYLLLLTSYLYYALHRQPIAVQSEAGYHALAARTYHGVVAELLACVYIRYMYLYDRCGERTDAVEQCHRGVGICARIQYRHTRSPLPASCLSSRPRCCFGNTLSLCPRISFSIRADSSPWSCCRKSPARVCRAGSGSVRL